MKNTNANAIKLHGMRALCAELANGYNNRNGFYTEIHLDRATGEVWGKMMSQNSWSAYPEHSSCVRTSVDGLAGYLYEQGKLWDYGFESVRDRNAAIREWAEQAIAEYNA